MSGVAFIDAGCPGCGAHVGWYGRMADRPACPRCGHRPEQESLDAVQAQIDDFRRLESGLQAANPGWGRWREARIAAGLTLRQAAKLLEIYPSSLSDVEQGRASPMPELMGRMKRCYGGGDIARTSP